MQATREFYGDLIKYLKNECGKNDFEFTIQNKRFYSKTYF
jgi:hypothetical protein